MKYIPNSFQIANAVVDDFLSRMSGSAWKCYTIIARKTTGWQKEMDYIPVAQFKTKTNIKKDDTVTDALKELEELGLIISIKRQGQVTGYRLNMPEPTPENGGTTTPENGVHPKNRATPENGGYPPPKMGGTTTPENGVHPKNGATPENGGYPPPKMGGTTTPENGGSSKHTTKPTNTKHNIHASAAADAPVSAEPESKPDKPKKRKPSAARIELEAYRLLGEHGIDGQLAQDYIALRKSHRAPITQTALKGIEREANSAGLSLEQALTICCERGWRGFRAEWLHSDRGNHPAQPKPNRINTVPQHTNGGAHLAKDIL